MSRIVLSDIYDYGPSRTEILYKLLSERKPHENISHKKMPSMSEHYKFVESKPHKAWYFIQLASGYFPVVGHIYLGKANNIGIGVFKEFRRVGYAEDAIKALMKFHNQAEYTANINPENHKSIDLFEKLGFKYQETQSHPGNILQHVYKKSRLSGVLSKRVKLRPLLVEGS